MATAFSSSAFDTDIDQLHRFLVRELDSLTWDKCRQLMIQLKWKKSSLDKIEEDHRMTDRRKSEALYKWLNATLSPSTTLLDDIIQALQKIDENSLAKQISDKYKFNDPRIESRWRYIQTPKHKDQRVIVERVEDQDYCVSHFGPAATNCAYYTVALAKTEVLSPLHRSKKIEWIAKDIQGRLTKFLENIEKSEHKDRFRVGYEARFGRLLFGLQEGSENNSAASVKDFVPNLRIHKKTQFLAQIKHDIQPLLREVCIFEKSDEPAKTASFIDPLKFQVDGLHQGLYIAVVQEDIHGTFTLKAVYRQPEDQRNSAKYDIVLAGKKYDIRIGDNCGPLEKVNYEAQCYKIALKITRSMRRETEDKKQISMKFRGEVEGSTYFVRFFRQKTQEQYIWKRNKKWILAKYNVDTFLDVRSSDKAAEMFEKDAMCEHVFDPQTSRMEIELWNQKKYPLYVDDTKPDRNEYQNMESAGPIHFRGEKLKEATPPWTTGELVRDFEEFLQAAYDISNILETQCPPLCH